MYVCRKIYEEMKMLTAIISIKDKVSISSRIKCST